MREILGLERRGVRFGLFTSAVLRGWRAYVKLVGSRFNTWAVVVPMIYSTAFHAIVKSKEVHMSAK